MHSGLNDSWVGKHKAHVPEGNKTHSGRWTMTKESAEILTEEEREGEWD